MEANARGKELIVSGGNTITFNGNTSQIIPPFNTPNDNGIDGYHNLTFTGSKVFSGDIAVSGVLNFTGAGNITLGTRNLTIGESGSITGPFSASQMIITDSSGKLIKNFSLGTQSFQYPIGSGTDFTPVQITIDSVTAAGSVGAKVTALTSGIKLLGNV